MNNIGAAIILVPQASENARKWNASVKILNVAKRFVEEVEARTLAVIVNAGMIFQNVVVLAHVYVKERFPQRRSAGTRGGKRQQRETNGGPHDIARFRFFVVRRKVTTKT
eukprot:GEMP01121082.1.p2 GENE.GEMP01121082.1~~GEMP01121082.1.p2  ORF type:complete len:110 (-),score=18.27 GEMP01121082.1:4-333(-)